jgi:hypothetical protein
LNYAPEGSLASGVGVRIIPPGPLRFLNRAETRTQQPFYKSAGGKRRDKPACSLISFVRPLDGHAISWVTSTFGLGPVSETLNLEIFVSPFLAITITLNNELWIIKTVVELILNL